MSFCQSPEAKKHQGIPSEKKAWWSLLLFPSLELQSEWKAQLDWCDCCTLKLLFLTMLIANCIQVGTGWRSMPSIGVWVRDCTSAWPDRKVKSFPVLRYTYACEIIRAVGAMLCFTELLSKWRIRASRSQITLCSVNACIFTYLKCTVNGSSTFTRKVYMLCRYFYVLMSADGHSSKRLQAWKN